MNDLTIRSTVTLAGGVAMPRLGLGVYRTPPGSGTRAAVAHALEVGYRHFDTAALYGNEADVGAAVRESGIARDEVFITTKLWNSDHGYTRALRAFDQSCKRLGVDTVDLYLIHWPVVDRRADSWRALEQLQREGRCRAIGVSNYTIHHLEQLLASCKIPPAVDQVEFSPFLYQRELLEYCRSHGIQLEAYSPLTKGRMLDDARLAAVAARYERTPAQVLVRWSLQRDLVVIPKSADSGRIGENARVFDFVISDEDMAALDALDAGIHTSWDPTDLP